MIKYAVAAITKPAPQKISTILESRIARLISQINVIIAIITPKPAKYVSINVTGHVL
jgi:hypothetical protein